MRSLFTSHQPSASVKPAKSLLIVANEGARNWCRPERRRQKGIQNGSIAKSAAGTSTASKPKRAWEATDPDGRGVEPYRRVCKLRMARALTRGPAERNGHQRTVRCWERGHRGQPASRRPRAIVSAGLLLVLVHRLASATSFSGPRRGGLRRDRWRLGTIKDRRSFLKERCHRFLGVRGSNSRGEFLVLDLYRLLDLPTHGRLQQSLAGL